MPSPSLDHRHTGCSRSPQHAPRRVAIVLLLALFAQLQPLQASAMYIVDLNTNQVVTSAGNGSLQEGMVVTPDGNKVYVTNTTSNTTSVISTATNTVIKTIRGSYPRFLALNPTGTRLYIANYSNNSVQVVDTSTDTVIATISGWGSHVTGIAVSPDGRRAYATTSAPGTQNEVVVLDLTNNTYVETWRTGGGAQTLLVNAAGTKLYLGDWIFGTVRVVDIATKSVSNTIHTSCSSPAGLAFRPGSNELWAGDSDGAHPTGGICVIDTTTNAQTRFINLPQRSAIYYIGFSADGARAYTTDGTSSTGSDFLTIDAPTGTIRSTLANAVSYYAAGAVLNPGRTLAYVPANSSTLPPAPPLVKSFSPPNNATGVDPRTNLILTFYASVLPQAGGTLTIKKTSDNSTVETIDVTSNRVSGGGTATITVDPVADLGLGTDYYVLISSNAFKDVSTGLFFAGIANATTWHFTTLVPIGSVTYHLYLKNAGPDAATGIVVTDLVPTGLFFTGATFAGSPTTLCTTQGAQVVCTFDPAYTLSRNDTNYHQISYDLDLTFVYFACPASNAFTNTATIHSAVYDPDTGNNVSNTATKPASACP